MCPNTNYIVYSFRICGLLLWRKQIHKLICLQHKRACRLNSLPLHFRPYAYRTKELKFHYFRTGYLTAVEKPTGNWYEPLCVSQNPDRSQAIHVSTRQWAKIKERESEKEKQKKSYDQGCLRLHRIVLSALCWNSSLDGKHNLSCRPLSPNSDNLCTPPTDRLPWTWGYRHVASLIMISPGKTLIYL